MIITTAALWVMMKNMDLNTDFDTGFFHLFKNDIALSPGIVLGDFVEADYTGYANQATVPLGLAYDDPAGNAILELTPKVFQPTGSAVTNVVFGWWWQDVTGATPNMIVADRFPVPVTLAGTADAVVVGGRIAFNQPVGL